MRIFPIALIVIGALGVAKHLDLIPVGMLHLIGPLLLIALGLALLFRHRRICGSGWRSREGCGSASAPRPPSAEIV